jgi:hypothetical protein
LVFKGLNQQLLSEFHLGSYQSNITVYVPWSLNWTLLISSKVAHDTYNWYLMWNINLKKINNFYMKQCSIYYIFNQTQGRNHFWLISLAKMDWTCYSSSVVATNKYWGLWSMKNCKQHICKIYGVHLSTTVTLNLGHFCALVTAILHLRNGNITVITAVLNINVSPKWLPFREL